MLIVAIACTLCAVVGVLLLWYRYESLLNDATKQCALLHQKILDKSKILDSLPYPVWVRDDKMRLIYSNAQCQHFFGAKDKLDTVINQTEQLLAKEASVSKSCRSEELHITVDGKRYLYNFIEIPTDYGVLSTAYDCSSKWELKLELQRHVAAQSDLLESTISAVAVYGADHKLKFFNQAFVKLWNLDEKWLVKQPLYSDILDLLRDRRQLPEQIDFQKFKKEQLKLFTDLTLTHNDFLYLPDGRSLRVIVIQHALGGLLFSYEDMTDRLALERSYKTLAAVQRSTIDNLNEGITVFNENGRLQISNTGFAKIWKIDKEAMSSNSHIASILEKMYPMVSGWSSLDSFKAEFFRQINNRSNHIMRLSLLNDSVVDVLFVPLTDGGTLICCRDISDTVMIEKVLIEKNKALQEADRLKTEFLANVSYELRSPLTSIVGFAGLLLNTKSGILSIKQHEYVSAINESSQYLTSLIDDILDLASVDAGYMTLDISKFDFAKIVEEVRGVLKERVRERKLVLNVIGLDKTFLMMGDVKRMKQVVFNILSNATNRVSHGSNLNVVVRNVLGKYIVLKVEIENCYHEVVDPNQFFNKFYDTSGPVQNRRDNLGMFLVKSIVEMHAGRVKLYVQHNHNIIVMIVPCDGR